ncbi:MAG: hypothetical protein ACMUIL_04355 [bacterium]
MSNRISPYPLSIKMVNNAILIVDQFNIHVREGATRHRAMITATCERFRPIIMITLA